MSARSFAGTNPFQTSGVLARPAGLPCGALAAAPGFDSRFLASSGSYGDAITRPGKPFGTAAVVAPPGWVPKEASVNPTYKEIPAGMDSVVDNTMRFRPLAPRYGKTREISPNEISPVQRTLAPDLLATSKGMDTQSLPTVRSPERMCAVLAPYAPNATLFQSKYDPERRTAGFLRSPTSVGGQMYIAEAASQTKMKQHDALAPSADETWRTKKFVFDRTANIAHIPVVKRVGDYGDFSP